MDEPIYDSETQQLIERKKIIHSIIFPALFILLIWIVKLFEVVYELDLYYLGIFPKKASGLIGILFSPLIHANFNHLFDNSVTLFVLTVAVFYFYRPIQYKVFFLAYILTGIWVWFGGRQSYHIGASGIIYGLASFVFLSGLLRYDIRLMAISLLVVFLYGSLIWGIFPIKKDISWESHLWGGVAGAILAVHYRRHGPQRPKYDWENDNDEEEENSQDPPIGEGPFSNMPFS